MKKRYLVFAVFILAGCSNQQNASQINKNQDQLQFGCNSNNSGTCSLEPQKTGATTTEGKLVDGEEAVTDKILPPVDNFFERVTKKSFGIYITPNDSPVQPERFSGYHTGVDVEFGDATQDVDVRSIADGTVVFVGRVNGYGGVVAIEYNIKNQQYVAIYGHLKPDFIVVKDQDIVAGQKIGILGQGFTQETDGERKHLHLGLHRGSDLALLGYVPDKQNLNNWEDPLELITK